MAAQGKPNIVNVYDNILKDTEFLKKHKIRGKAIQQLQLMATDPKQVADVKSMRAIKNAWKQYKKTSTISPVQNKGNPDKGKSIKQKVKIASGGSVVQSHEQSAEAARKVMLKNLAKVENFWSNSKQLPIDQVKGSSTFKYDIASNNAPNEVQAAFKKYSNKAATPGEQKLLGYYAENGTLPPESQVKPVEFVDKNGAKVKLHVDGTLETGSKDGNIRKLKYQKMDLGSGKLETIADMNQRTPLAAEEELASKSKPNYIMNDKGQILDKEGKVIAESMDDLNAKAANKLAGRTGGKAAAEAAAGAGAGLAGKLSKAGAVATKLGKGAVALINPLNPINATFNAGYAAYNAHRDAPEREWGTKEYQQVHGKHGEWLTGAMDSLEKMVGDRNGINYNPENKVRATQLLRNKLINEMGVHPDVANKVDYDSIKNSFTTYKNTEQGYQKEGVFKGDTLLKNAGHALAYGEGVSENIASALQDSAANNGLLYRSAKKAKDWFRNTVPSWIRGSVGVNLDDYIPENDQSRTKFGEPDRQRIDIGSTIMGDIINSSNTYKDKELTAKNAPKQAPAKKKATVPSGGGTVGASAYTDSNGVIDANKALNLPVYPKGSYRDSRTGITTLPDGSRVYPNGAVIRLKPGGTSYTEDKSTPEIPIMKNEQVGGQGSNIRVVTAYPYPRRPQ